MVTPIYSQPLLAHPPAQGWGWGRERLDGGQTGRDRGFVPADF